MAANMVKTTTAPKATAPNPARIIASDFNCTSATRDGHDENIEHGPTTDLFDNSVHLRALHGIPERPPLHRDQQEGHPEQLSGRNEHAGDKYHECQISDPECQR